MDTPERNQGQKHAQNQIGTPGSKFEDSPVFNYINSLSPIKPVKSAHITQIFTSLNFGSPPSVFTSPHLSSYRESRFMKRQLSPDPSKCEFDLANENSACSSKEKSVQLYDNSADLQENFDTGASTGEASVQTPSKQFKALVELPRSLKYVSGSPDCKIGSRGSAETDSSSGLAGASTARFVPVFPRSSEKGLEGNLHLQEMCQIEQNKEGPSSNWDNMIFDAADLVIFSSPSESQILKGLMQKPLDCEASFSASIMSEYPQHGINYTQKAESFDPVGPGEQHQTEDHLLQPRESMEPLAVDAMHENLANYDGRMARNVGDKTENEAVSYLHRGIRRRCLDFEMVGGQNKESTASGSSSMPQSDEKVTPEDKQLVPFKPGTDTSKRPLPGIGLHLNALGATLKDFKQIKLESSNSGREQLKFYGNNSLSAGISGQDSLDRSLASASAERGPEVAENEVQLAEQASLCLTNEECNPTSPKKKRRKVEPAGEPESCKRCNCKKSKCLKLYCECFAAGVYCIEPCSCQDCFNKPIHEDTVLATRKQIESRNPLAFAPKVIRTSDFASETGDESNKTPASARHKRGCNCKKSSCLKKYCECYQGGVGCSINCRCEGCKNVFGRKDALMGVHAEHEEESESCEKTEMDRSFQRKEVGSEEQNAASALPTTPLQLSRPLVQLPFSMKSRTPGSSSFVIGSSSGLYAGQQLGKSNFIQPQPKFENQLQTVPEDEIPEVLQENCSPGNAVKAGSPNGKRISAPSSDFGSSPARRSGRKLILQSIPSFPSLSLQN